MAVKSFPCEASPESNARSSRALQPARATGGTDAPPSSASGAGRYPCSQETEGAPCPAALSASTARSAAAPSIAALKAAAAPSAAAPSVALVMSAPSFSFAVACRM